MGGGAIMAVVEPWPRVPWLWTWKEVTVDFSLIYEGPLPAKPDKRHCLQVKHEIRKQIHWQLKELIESHGHAIAEAVHKGESIGGYFFIPLVIDEFHMICELDIQFFRREKLGNLISKPKDEYGGDLDNRLKIFLDALRMPTAESELPPFDDSLHPKEKLIYCLLEDDALITRFQVKSKTLLTNRPKSQGPKDVKLVVDVSVRLTQRTEKNRDLLI
jgi:hypothetical protein